MNINKAAKLLIKLGIPGKEKERAVKDAVKDRTFKNTSTDQKEALEKYVEKLLVRWAYTDEIISKPESRGKGRGKKSDWSTQDVVEAAAVWSMKYYNGNVCPKEEKILPKAVTLEWINAVKQFAKHVYVSPHPFYRLTDRMIDDIWPDDPFTYKDVDMKLDKNDTLHRLTVTYIGALEKARRGIPMKQPMRIILKRDILEREHIPVPEFLSKAHLDRMLAKAAGNRGRKLTRDELGQVKRLHKMREETSPGVLSDLDIDLESTDAGCDEIVLMVRQPGEKEWMDSRKLAMRCKDESP